MDWKKIISKLPYPGRARREREKVTECLKAELARRKEEWNLRLLEDAIVWETESKTASAALPPLQTLWIEDIAVTGMEYGPKRNGALLRRIKTYLIGKRKTRKERK